MRRGSAVLGPPLRLLRWLAHSVVVLLGVSLVTFALTALVPGDLAENMLSSQGVAPSEQMVRELRQQLGLDLPLWQQYLHWLWGVLHGDLGTSLSRGSSIAADFALRIPMTITLTFVSLAIMWAIAVPVGLLIAMRRDSLLDRAVRLLCFGTSALPGFLVALAVLYVLGVQWQWFPIAASQDLRGMTMPLVTMVLASTGWYVRQVRAIALEQLDMPYVAGLRLRGMSERRIGLHVLRNSAAPLCPVAGSSVGALLAGTAVIETMFSWQGLGHYALASIQTKDYPVIQSYVLWCAVAFLAANALSDLAALALDPRLGGARTSRTKGSRPEGSEPGAARTRLDVRRPDLAALARRRGRPASTRTMWMPTLGPRGWWVLLGLLVLFVLVGACSPWLTPFDPFRPQPEDALLPPGGPHLLGTDELGRDIFARVLAGVLPTASVALTVTGCALVLGTVVGVVAALTGGWVDALLQRATAVFQSFPEFILALSVAAMMGSGFLSVTVALAAVYWTGIARYARVLTLQVRDAPYVQAARMNGMPALRIVGRHLVPNIAAPLLVLSGSNLGGVVLNLATLSFLGLGLPQPTSEWGTMISTGRDYIQVAPWLVYGPGVALFLLILLFNLFADATQQRMSATYRPASTKKRDHEALPHVTLLSPASDAPAAGVQRPGL